jgi:hypothetical protein
MGHTYSLPRVLCVCLLIETVDDESESVIIVQTVTHQRFCFVD